jgi:hypothetical protein
VEPLGSLAQLAGRLRAAQHQHRQHGKTGTVERQRLVEQVAVLRRTASGTARQTCPAATNEPRDGIANRLLVVVDDRLTAGRLVRREAQRVERQRVGVGRRALLLDQRAEHAQFGGIGLDHSWITTPGAYATPPETASTSGRSGPSQTRY